MEIKADALVLRTADYGEHDRMVTLLTADRGKIGAAVKGVRKAGAKLRFAAQPFCFAEYVLAERAGRYTVISASLYDGFYSLREDIGALYAASAVCEACDGLMYEGMVDGRLLVEAVGALRAMAAGETARPLVKFLLAALRLAGYPVRAGECPFCGKPLTGRIAFEFAGGTFCCAGCAGTPASLSTYHTVRSALGLSCDGALCTEDGLRRALRLLRAYYAAKIGGDLSALASFLGLF